MPIEDGPGLEMSELEEEILTSFGLPGTAFRYSSMMQQQGFNDEDAEGRAEELYGCLLQEAETFLLSPAKSSTEQLKEYKKNWTMVQDALPFLGFDFTRYTGFLYQDIYLLGLCSEEELLRSLHFAKDYCLQDGKIIPYEYEMLMEEPCYWALDKAGLPYLHEYLNYLQYIAEPHDWDMDTTHLPPQDLEQVEDDLILRLFFISCIDIVSKKSVSIEVMIPEDDSFQTIKIWCKLEDMNYLLRFARYGSMVSHLQMSTDDFEVINCPYTYDVYQIEERTHEISRCQLTLERLGQEEENDPDPFHYHILEIIPLDEIDHIAYQEINDLPF